MENKLHIIHNTLHCYIFHWICIMHYANCIRHYSSNSWIMPYTTNKVSWFAIVKYAFCKINQASHSTHCIMIYAEWNILFEIHIIFQALCIIYMNGALFIMHYMYYDLCIIQYTIWITDSILIMLHNSFWIQHYDFSIIHSQLCIIQ